MSQIFDFNFNILVFILEKNERSGNNSVFTPPMSLAMSCSHLQRDKMTPTMPI